MTHPTLSYFFPPDQKFPTFSHNFGNIKKSKIPLYPILQALQAKFLSLK